MRDLPRISCSSPLLRSSIPRTVLPQSLTISSRGLNVPSCVLRSQNRLLVLTKGSLQFELIGRDPNLTQLGSRDFCVIASMGLKACFETFGAAFPRYQKISTRIDRAFAANRAVRASVNEVNDTLVNTLSKRSKDTPGEDAPAAKKSKGSLPSEVSLPIRSLQALSVLNPLQKETAAPSEDTKASRKEVSRHSFRRLSF